MKTQIFTLLALASSAQVATATFQWLDAKKFSCPANTDNQCIEPQKNGFKWEGLNLGDFTNFGDFEFDGFKCADSFDGKTKRDQITGRTFQNKCIKSTVTPDKSASFGCTKSKSVKQFSVKTFQVSVEYDTDLEFHYDMPDGSTCKQKQSCKKNGTTVKNTQCGGATKVKVKVPKGGKKCDVGFHHIDFDCEPPKDNTPPKSTTTSTSALPSTTPVIEKPSTTPVIEIPSSSSPVSEVPSTTPVLETPSTTPVSEVPSTTPVEEVPSTTPVLEIPSTTPASSTPASETETIPIPAESTTSTESPVQSTVPPFPVNGTTSAPPSGETAPPPVTFFTTSVFTETHVSTITSCGSEVKDCPAGSSTVITQTSVSSTLVPVTTQVPSTVVVVDSTTVIVQTSTTLCPVTATHVTSGLTTIETGISTSTILITSTSTVCTKCALVPTSAASTAVESSPVTSAPVVPVSSTTSSSGPLPTADCPAVLPQCLNTWLFSSGCKSNTDVNCFCSSSDFVDNIYKCLSAHGASDDEVDSAEKYFQGICAAHVPENPAIITGVNTLTITAAPPAYTAPVTTIFLETTIVVPCTQTEGPSEGSIIPGSSTTKIISTAVTVPQVVFQTITGTSTNVVSLIQGTPTAPATITGFTTPAVPVPVKTGFTSIFANGTATTSSPPQFTGAASRSGMTAGSFIAAGLVALMAL